MTGLDRPGRDLGEERLDDDGLQLKWLAPTDIYLQFGAEVGSGLNFPASDRATNGAGAWALYAHVGGDVGDSHTWRVPVCLTSARGLTVAALKTPTSTVSP